LPREALLLRRRDDLAVTHEARGAVVIERRDPENVQGGRSAGGPRSAAGCLIGRGHRNPRTESGRTAPPRPPGLVHVAAPPRFRAEPRPPPAPPPPTD